MTISRILGRGVVAEELEKTLHHYLVRHSQASRSVLVATDCKMLRGTIEVGQSRGVHLLAAYLPQEAIENGLHYRRDVTLREDRSRLPIGSPLVPS